MDQEQVISDATASESSSGPLNNHDSCRMSKPCKQEDHPHHSSSTTFSIATPAVTTILPMTENLNDTSFMHLPANSYQQDTTIERSFHREQQEPPNNTARNLNISNNLNAADEFNLEEEKQTDEDQVDVACPEKHIINSDKQLATLMQSTGSQEDTTKLVVTKKRNKITKKNTKLDAKSKLEKSRQSARECRARKKLRYQYLEDLVSNREKAVIKLREEFSMFCELSKQIVSGTISESDRRLLVDQTKENNRSESTSLP